MNTSRLSKFPLILLLATLTACQATPPPAQPSITPSVIPADTITSVSTPPATISPTLTSTTALPWWNDRLFYEIFVRSFKDSDGDGIGDLQGLIEKLDYLNDGDPTTTSDLGVTGLWLMPVTESPSYHGYDVVDYRAIDQDYGTNEDFKLLIEEAHRRGMVVIIDMVMNHTSSQNPWFEQSAKRGSPTEDWYIWSPVKSKYLSPWGTEVWHQLTNSDLADPKTTHLNDYYYGLFWSGMPDLNYRNQAVTAEMYDILAYWLEDLGVDGFRLDAIRHLIENGPIQENTPETHAWLQNFDDYVHTVKPETLTVGEIWDSTFDVAPYVPDEVDIAFEFTLADAIISAAGAGDQRRLTAQMKNVLDAYPAGQYAPFLTNHDMTRVMSELGGHPAKARLAATLLLSMPGVPFIYYGEEIGLTGVKTDDLELRRPMQWDSSPTYGFTTGTPWAAPGTPDPAVNVEAQSGDPDSLLSHYRRLIHLRNQHAPLRTGDTWLVPSSHRRIFSMLRYLDGEAVLLVANLSGKPVTDYTLSLESGPLQGALAATLLLGEGSPAVPQVNTQGGFADYVPLPELGAYQAVLIQLLSQQ